MCKVYKRIGAVFCTFGIILMFIAGLMFNTSAAEQKKGSLTLTCENEGVALANMNWMIYKVGEVKDDVYSLTDEFANYPVDLSKIMESTETMTEAASTLSNFAVLDEIFPELMTRTNSDGVAIFKNLEPGLYLAVGNRLKIDSMSYFPTPFLVQINGNDISSYPKFMVKYTLPGEMDRFSLRKIWANATIVDNIPDNLTIEIYKDGELFDTVTISPETNWTYSWDGDASSEWRVKEVTVPGGCFVMYRNNEVQFIIMNSYDSDLLAKVTTTATTAASTIQTVTTVVSNDDYTSSTTKNSLIDIYDGTATTVTSTVSGYVQNATTVSSNNGTIITTVKNTLNDFGNASSTVYTTPIPTGVQPGGSSVSGNGTGTVTTVSGDKGTGTGTVGTGIETYPTDTNGSVITTKVTTKKGDSGDSGNKSTKSSKGIVTTTSIEKLPQTGQLWWPVPVMLLGGLIFVAIGLRLLLDNRKED